jgi:hypothetical protein
MPCNSASFSDDTVGPDISTIVTLTTAPQLWQVIE